MVQNQKVDKDNQYAKKGLISLIESGMFSDLYEIQLSKSGMEHCKKILLNALEAGYSGLSGRSGLFTSIYFPPTHVFELPDLEEGTADLRSESEIRK